MSHLHFDKHIGGSKTFWVIDFKSENPEEIAYEGTDFQRPKPAVDFLIPSPAGDDEWMIADFKATSEALASLNRIQEICSEIKKSCETDVEKIEDYVDKTKTVSDELNTLDAMIKHFNEIMKKFKKEPPKDEENPTETL